MVIRLPPSVFSFHPAYGTCSRPSTSSRYEAGPTFLSLIVFLACRRITVFSNGGIPSSQSDCVKVSFRLEVSESFFLFAPDGAGFAAVLETFPLLFCGTFWSCPLSFFVLMRHLFPPLKLTSELLYANGFLGLLVCWKNPQFLTFLLLRFLPKRNRTLPSPVLTSHAWRPSWGRVESLFDSRFFYPVSRSGFLQSFIARHSPLFLQCVRFSLFLF